MSISKYVPSEKARLSIYVTIAALLAVLGFYKFIDAAAVPLWLNLAGTLLGVAGSAGAATALATQRSNKLTPETAAVIVPVVSTEGHEAP